MLVLHQSQWNIEPGEAIRELLAALIQLRFLMRQDLLTTPKERALQDNYLEEMGHHVVKQTKLTNQLLNRLSILTENQNQQASIFSLCATFVKVF